MGDGDYRLRQVEKVLSFQALTPSLLGAADKEDLRSDLGDGVKVRRKGGYAVTLSGKIAQMRASLSCQPVSTSK